MSDEQAAGPSRVEAAVTALVASCSFAVYALGAARTIYVGDSGELVAAVHTLGIPHPSGYPLYVLLGKLWSLLLPVGSVALRMGLFSAACAAASVAVAYRMGRGALGLDRGAALCGALLLAVAPSFWGEANVPRVYALNALFVLLAAERALAWDRGRRPRELVAAFLLCGLGATNHTFLLAQAAVIAGWAVWREPALRRRLRLIAGCGLALGAGLLPYAFLPLRSLTDPALDWGDPQTPGRFLAVVLRADYWGRAWVQGPGDALRAIGDFLWSVLPELQWGGAALAIAGAIASRRRAAGFVSLALLIAAANLAAMLAHGSRTDLFVWHRYDIPAYAMAALLAGLGAQAVRPHLRALPLLLPLAGLVAGWSDFDRSRYRLADAFARRILEPLPPDALLAASDDNVLFPLMYLHFVEGVRPDVTLILQGAGTPPPLRFDPDREALFFTHHPGWDAPQLELVPVGPVFRVVRRGAAPPSEWSDPGPLPGLDDPRVPRDFLSDNLVGHDFYMRGVTALRGDPVRALAALERAAWEAPRDPVLAYNLGLVYARNGLLPEAAAAFARSQRLEPRRLIGGGDAGARLAEVREEDARLRPLLRELARDLAPPGSGARHAALAEAFARRGEARAARGESILALRAGAAQPR